MLILHCVVIVIFIVLGILFSAGKCASLIVNDPVPRDEAQALHLKTLCKYVGRLMFICAACWLVIAANEILGKLWLLWLGLGLFVLVCVLGVIFMNTGSRKKL
jgi:formate/nitrite transporter FocA (FNT family)